MKRVAMFLTQPQIDAMAAIAKTLGLTFSELVRRALDIFIEQQAKGKKS